MQLVYELHITNFAPEEIALTRIQVLDAEKGLASAIFGMRSSATDSADPVRRPQARMNELSRPECGPWFISRSRLIARSLCRPG
jgi:hypothetical protein